MVEFSILPNMNQARAWTTATMAGEYLYVFGGEAGGYNSFLSSIEMLHVKGTPDPQWELIPEPEVTPPETLAFAPRKLACVCALSATEILICGGWRSGTSLNDVIVFNTKTKKAKKKDFL